VRLDGARSFAFNEGTTTMKTPQRIPLAGLIAATLLALSGCSKPILDFRNVEMPDGLIYASGANEPFTGTVTHVPDSFLLSDAKGYAKFVQEAGGDGDAVARFVRFARGSDSPTFLCDVSARKGYVEGKATCYVPGTDTKLIEAHFSGGRLSGGLIYYNPDSPAQKLIEGGFDAGQPDGTEKIYSPSTGKLVESVNWSDGAYDGDFARYNATNGKVVLEGAFAEGKRDGGWKQYTDDGTRLTDRWNYQKGQHDGVGETFDSETGKRIALIDKWVDGKINGEHKTWDKNGVLLTDEVYVDGKKVADENVTDASHTDSEPLEGRLNQALAGAVSTAASPSPAATSPASPATLDACVQGWTTANHDAAAKAGVDDVVTADQVDEWEAWCKQGKQAPAG
jgi:antitoxin component YwqK of YwqJK toxin-antitoxin module